MLKLALNYPIFLIKAMPVFIKEGIFAKPREVFLWGVHEHSASGSRCSRLGLREMVQAETVLEGFFLTDHDQGCLKSQRALVNLERRGDLRLRVFPGCELSVRVSWENFSLDDQERRGYEYRRHLLLLGVPGEAVVDFLRGRCELPTIREGMDFADSVGALAFMAHPSFAETENGDLGEAIRKRVIPFADELRQVACGLIGLESDNLGVEKRLRGSYPRWREQITRFAEEKGLLCLTGADSHERGRFGTAGILTLERPISQDDLLHMIRAGDYLNWRLTESKEGIDLDGRALRKLGRKIDSSPPVREWRFC